VHYVSHGSPDGRYRSVCRAALVTEVTGPGALVEGGALVQGLVSVAVLNPSGLFFDQGLEQSEDEHVGGTWHWPCVPEQESDD
jgi:hypothetical protein